MKHVSKIAGAIIVAIALLLVTSCQNKSPVVIKPSRHKPVTDKQYIKRLAAARHFIDSATAQTWIQRYMDKRDSICHDSLDTAQWVLPYSSESFNSQAIQSILDLENCTGVRVFLGINDSSHVRFLLGGVDTLGNTLYVDSLALTLKRIKGNMAGRSAPPPPSANRTNSNKGLVEMGLEP